MKHKRKERLIIWVAKGMAGTGRSLKDSLAAALPRKRVLMVRSTSKLFIPRDSDIFINWGNTHLPGWLPNHLQLFNRLYAVHQAVNKLNTFKHLAGKVNTPEWTTESDIARCWARDDGELVVCRTLLTGSGGKGIILTDDEDEIEDLAAPLYVRYKKKKHEYRVHVFDGQVIDLCMKRKRRDWPEEINTKIRNMDGGWIFARDDIFIPDDLEDQAIRAVDALGLDFGAVDVIWNKRENKSYVLEVNTAPGLVGTSLARYTQAIKEAL